MMPWLICTVADRRSDENSFFSSRSSKAGLNELYYKCLIKIYKGTFQRVQQKNLHNSEIKAREKLNVCIFFRETRNPTWSVWTNHCSAFTSKQRANNMAYPIASGGSLAREAKMNCFFPPRIRKKWEIHPMIATRWIKGCLLQYVMAQFRWTKPRNCRGHRGSRHAWWRHDGGNPFVMSSPNTPTSGFIRRVIVDLLT